MNTIEFFQNLEQSLQKRLRDYQREGIQEIDSLLDQGVKLILRQNFTGTGKSVEQNYLAIRHLAQSENNTVLLLAHREELIENLAEYFNENKVYLSFIKSGLATLFNTRVYIASVDTLKNRLDKLPIQPTLIMADECFPAGTLIDGKPIENYKVGDYVWSVDEKSGHLDKKRVVHIFKNPVKNLVKVKTFTGKEIICTSNHPFFTINRGWINAIDLSKNDELLCLSNTSFDDKKQNKQLLSKEISVLFQGMQHKTSKNISRLSRKSKVFSMSETSNPGQETDGKFQKFWTCLLFKLLYKFNLFSNKFRDYEQDQQNIYKSENEVKQSNFKTRSKRKNKSNFITNRSQTKDTRRKRETFIKTSEIFISVVKWCWTRFLGHRIYSTHQFVWNGISNTLQTGYSEQSINDSNRSRREQSLCYQQTETGQKERQFFTVDRLESVEIYQQRSYRTTENSFEKNYVYNLEVEDYHTYFAENILVHNCHHSPAKSWKKILDYYPDAIKLGFSATPERLDGKSFTDLYQGLVTGKPYQWYIDNHYLAPFQFVNPGHFVSFDFKKTRGDFDLQQQEEILNNDVINADAVDTWHKFTPGLKTVVFCSSVEHSKQVRNAYNNFGMSEYGKEIAEHLDGTSDKNYRREIIKRFKLPVEHSESLLILSNFQLFVEGVNIPSASVTQWLRKTSSEIIYDQGNGRSNRYVAGKVQYIIDHVGNKLIHGYPNRIRSYDLKGRKEREQEAKYHLICPACKTVVHTDYRRLQNAAETVNCPGCDCTIPVPKPKKRSPRKEKEIDLDIEMVLDACQDTYSVNMQALFRRYNHLNTKRYFESLLKHEHLTLEDFKAACVYRNLSENHAYAAWSKKLQHITSIT